MPSDIKNRFKFFTLGVSETCLTLPACFWQNYTTI